MKICVITKCAAWSGDVIGLEGNQWRLYDCGETGPSAYHFKGIKVRPFHVGEILFLDDYDQEIGPGMRKPYKSGVEARYAKRAGKRASRIQFVICRSLKEALALVKSIRNE